MVKFIIGAKGSGKTNKLIESVNEAVKIDKGQLVFINDSKRHMFDLNYKVRLVDTQEFALKSYEALYGLICGIISQNYDISNIFIDSITKTVAGGDFAAAGDVIDAIAAVCDKHGVNLTVTASVDADAAPEFIKKYL
ncbi:MAG: hypothetical protein IKB55_03605 [Clostridia bacterium]|nr:hypothetical protein [Clostridia bacterium]